MAQSNSPRTQPGDDRTSAETAHRKPVEKFHDGPVHVSIWENAGPNGAFRTVSFQLRYRDQQQEWQTGTSYSASDLKHLEDAAREARTRIERWRNEKPRTDRAPDS